MTEQKAEYKIEGRPATIFRVVHDKDNPYVIINRCPIENSQLSFKAKGILTYLMSRPDGWEVSVSDLINRGTDGKASIRAGLKELRDAGHMRYTQSRQEGRITGWHIEVYEVPRDTTHGDNPTDEIIDEAEPPQVGDTTMRLSVSGGSPESDFQQVENQQVENRTQVVLSTLSIKQLKKEEDKSEENQKNFESAAFQVFGANVTGWRGMQRYLKDAQYFRDDGQFRIAGVGVAAAMCQDRYAKVFGNALSGVYNHPTEVIFEE